MLWVFSLLQDQGFDLWLLQPTKQEDCEFVCRQELFVFVSAATKSLIILIYVTVRLLYQRSSEIKVKLWKEFQQFSFLILTSEFLLLLPCFPWLHSKIKLKQIFGLISCPVQCCVFHFSKQQIIPLAEKAIQRKHFMQEFCLVFQKSQIISKMILNHKT